MDFQMIILVILLIVACIAGNYVKSKNGSSDDSSSAKNRSAKDNGGLIKCTNCGASIAANVRYCPYCGIEKRSGNIEIHHTEKVIIESRPSLLQHIVSERERTKQERLEKEERENRRYMIVMLIGLFGLGAFVVIMKLLYWK